MADRDRPAPSSREEANNTCPERALFGPIGTFGPSPDLEIPDLVKMSTTTTTTTAELRAVVARSDSQYEGCCPAFLDLSWSLLQGAGPMTPI